MSFDKKASVGISLVDLLRVPPSKRSPAEIEAICRLTSSFPFFQELISREDSSRLHLECCKVLSVETYLKDDYICRKGDEASSFYLVIRGSVSILSSDDLDSKSSCGRSCVEDKKSHIDLDNNLLAPPDESELSVLTAGQSFGELALINRHARYFSVRCLEPCILGVLNKEYYYSLAQVHERQINEKIEFIRNMEAFKNWSRIAVQKLSYFFNTETFRKKGVVYREGDLPTDIYIIKEGEFMFSQDFKIDIGGKNEEEQFGKISKVKPIKLVRKKELKLVIKQKGDIFGHEEIFENIEKRQFTCRCVSNAGELLSISDKNFAKKVLHPETLKYIEDTNSLHKKWVDKRIGNLIETERLKDQITFTPYSKIKVRSHINTPETKLPVIRSFTPFKESAPTILQKFLKHSKNKSIDRSEKSNLYFPTEIGNKSVENRSRANSSFSHYKQKSSIY